MLNPTIAAYIFCAFTIVVVSFQFALALGVPWGEMAMGGKFPGRLPPQMRVAALVQITLLVVIALIVLIRAGLTFSEYFEFSKSAIWFVVAFNIISAILNTLTPSKKERILWAPVTIFLLVCSFIVAIG